ncbi:MAG: hypothetical protein M3033_15965 [Acidobacteriota bacterium]|nr:hypothetical protein [Acidobacteriota bacterium]
MIKIFCLILFCACFAVNLATAQTNETDLETKRAEIKKLDGWVGQWKGTGWIQQGRERKNFVGTEIVQRKLDGLALLVEGRFTTKVVPRNEEKVIHETLAVISPNLKTKTYDFNTFLANGLSGSYELKAIESGWQWGFQFPQGSVRYFIKIEKNTWSETGEMMLNGKDWTKIFEMALQKVN